MDILASAFFLIVLLGVVSLTTVTLNREAAAIRAALTGKNGLELAVVPIRAPAAARRLLVPARQPRRAAV